MTAYLQALTPEAEASLGGAEQFEIHTWPCRVGRESRLIASPDGFKVMERRRTDAAPSNEVYLLDSGRPLNVSRAHFQLEKTDSGYVLRDRGSALGTFVGGQLIGGRDAGGVSSIHDGDVIVVGTSESPFVFRFVLSEDS